MKLAKHTLAVLFVCLALSPGFCRAQEITLGKMDEETFAAKLPDKITLSVNKTPYATNKAAILGWLNEKTELKYNPEYSSEMADTAYCPYENSAICQLTFSYANQSHIQKITTLSLDKNKLTDYVKNTLTKETDKAAQNATFEVTDGKITAFSLSSSGIAIDQTKTVAILENYLQEDHPATALTLPFITTQPTVTADLAGKMGVTSLIGEGVSNFVGSPHNRVINLETGAAKFNGTLIKPNEEFSFLNTLGPVDAEHGYLPELSIVGNATIPEYGGGMCQVSTTAFRAAVNTGLKITARENHAYPVGYYSPQGTDATVYIPAPDLKFVNNTPGYILIQTRVVGTQLIFDFYGTNDGRTVKTVGPTILERNPDGSMKTVWTQEVYDKTGALMFQDDFKSNYKSPSLYPHPGQQPTIITEKPVAWSVKQWNAYKKAHGL
ncbi:MAG: VanW family protein [Candidatus Pacebacteria bacterium]|nr:VanW family protein [Candidatus Paceibacterota bacterium]MDR3582974.1 VanW family protein [Candidatus Paceibacterota bacterium]